MTRDNVAKSDDSDARSGSAYTKPNTTIMERHDELLDELAETRYASRSEALRVAIDQLAESIQEDGKTGVEQLMMQISQLSQQLDDMADQLTELGDQVGPVPHQSPESELVQTGVTSVAERTTNQASTSLENDVYTALNRDGPMSEADIAEQVSTDQLNVRNALESLTEREFIARIKRNNTTQYDVAEPSGD